MEQVMDSENSSKIYIFLPFYAGNAVTNSDGDITFDGRIATKLVMVLLMAWVSIEVFLQLNDSQSVVCAEVVHISLTTIVLLGCLSCLLILCSAHSNRSQWMVQDPMTTFPLSGRLRLLFLWLFGICSIVFASFKIYVTVNCVEMTKHAHNYFVSNVIFNAVKITFIVIELIFVGYFSSARLTQSLKLHYGLTFIIVGNLSLWVYYFALDFVNNDLERSVASRLHNSGLNFTTECFFNSTASRIFIQVKRIIFPTVTEFALLGAIFVLKVWSTSMKQTEVNGLIQLHENLLDMSNNNIERGTAWGLGFNGQRIGLCNAYTCPFIIPIGVGLALFIPLLMMYIMLLHTSDVDTDLYNIISNYELGYKVIKLVFTICAWVLLQKDCKPTLRYKSLMPKDYITVLCTFGVAAYYINVVVVDVKSPVKSGMTEVSSGIVSLVDLYLQTAFILQAKGYTPKASDDQSCCGIHLFCLLIAVVNFGFWINDSFLGGTFSLSTIPKETVFGRDYWSFVIHYIFPFVIFYRFDSSFEFLDLYREFQ